MFHTYVVNSAGKQVSLERAQWLMSKQILESMPPDLPPQQMWDEYCLKHRLRFKQVFPFDVERADY